VTADGTVTDTAQTVSTADTDTDTAAPLSTRRQRRRVVVLATLRTLATIAIVVTLYYLLPMDRSMDDAAAAGLALGVVGLVAVVALQVWTISRSKYPTARGIEALAFTIPLYVLLFATTYYLMARAQPTAFSAPISRTDAMYFSSTVFTTVGFGDITAKSETARVIVTLQMMLDLVALGLAVRLVLNAVKVGQQRHAPNQG
jgi:voltage-gated potassium channel